MANHYTEGADDFTVKIASKMIERGILVPIPPTRELEQLQQQRIDNTVRVARTQLNIPGAVESAADLLKWHLNRGGENSEEGQGGL